MVSEYEGFGSNSGILASDTQQSLRVQTRSLLLYMGLLLAQSPLFWVHYSLVSGQSCDAHLLNPRTSGPVERSENTNQKKRKYWFAVSSDCARLPARPDRYVALFGEDQFDPSKRREAVSFEEQLRALEEVVKEGKVSARVSDNHLGNHAIA